MYWVNCKRGLGWLSGLRLCLFLSGIAWGGACISSLQAQAATFQVLDEFSREVVAGARVLDASGQPLAFTDRLGFFRLGLSYGAKQIIYIHHAGYQSDTFELNSQSQEMLFLYLRPRTLAPVSIEVAALNLTP